MNDPSSPVGADFKVGDIFGTSLTVFRQEFGKVILLAGLFLLPELLASFGLMRMVATGTMPPPIIYYGFVFGTMAAQILAQAPVVQVTYARLSGRPVRMIDALSRSRYGSALGVGFVDNLGTLTGIIVLGGQSLALTMVWFLMTAAFWYVALSAALIEDKGVPASLKRSAFLTKGHRVRILGIVLVAAIGPGLAPHFLDQIAYRFVGGTVAIVADFVFRLFVISIGTIIGTATYHALRTAKEGHDIETLSEVFA